MKRRGAVATSGRSGERRGGLVLLGIAVLVGMTRALRERETQRLTLVGGYGSLMAPGRPVDGPGVVYRKRELGEAWLRGWLCGRRPCEPDLGNASAGRCLDMMDEEGTLLAWPAASCVV